MLWIAYSRHGKAERYALTDTDAFVGRSDSCDVWLDDPSVSRLHARLRAVGDACVVTDLNSLNGTYCNGEPLSEGRVSPGDWLAFGQVSAEVQRSLDEEVALLDSPVALDEPVSIFREAGPPSASDQREDTPTFHAADASRWLALISETARLLVGNHTVDRLLERVADLAFNHLPQADRVVLVARDRATGALVPRVLRRRETAPRVSEPVTISRTVASTVMRDRRALLTTDVRMDERLTSAASALALGVRSLMCAPLWQGDEPFGVLYVDCHRIGSFGALDLDLLVALANYSSAAIEQAVLGQRLSQERRLRERLQRYHSPAVVTRILQSGSEADFSMVAVERDVTVVFADIVGFTRFAERASPAKVARLLNRYFERLTDVIFGCEGTVDKFIGDAVLALFGAPFEQSDHAWRAVRAARQMRQAVEELNAAAEDEPLQVRFAINSGLATVGDIGSSRRREFTVLGDVVNIASRIESEIARADQIVMTLDTYKRLPPGIDVRALGPTMLRGRTEPVDLFEVVTP